MWAMLTNTNKRICGDCRQQQRMMTRDTAKDQRRDRFSSGTPEAADRAERSSALRKAEDDDDDADTMMKAAQACRC